MPASLLQNRTLQASIQLDKSINSAVESHLITFTQYKKDRIKEEFLFSNTLLATTPAADVKALVDTFFKVNNLSWQNFKHICIGSAPAMIGIKSGFVTLVKTEWVHVMSLHCSQYQYTLASQTLPLHLMEVMDVVVKVFNFICLRAKNHRLFQLSTKEMGMQHVGLLFYTKLHWLLRGKCLS